MPQAADRRDPTRLHLVVMGDSCSGFPGTQHAENLAELSRTVLADPRPADALLFLGDHIAGYTDDAHEMNAQWDYFLNHELAALRTRYPITLHVPGNHDAFSPASADICQVRMPVPLHARHRFGLNYVYGLGDADIFCLATTDLSDHGKASADIAWLREALRRSKAPLRIVAGHHPIHPVNGFDAAPMWCFPEAQAGELWSLFVEHDVKAYFCSHIIAFDFQVHDDVVQLCSGGAGTVQPPTGVMGEGEYRHYVVCELDAARFTFEAIDAQGMPRERGGHDYPIGKALAAHSLGA